METIQVLITLLSNSALDANDYLFLVQRSVETTFYIVSGKHWVYPRSGAATAMMMKVPVFRYLNPCRLVRINFLISFVTF